MNIEAASTASNAGTVIMVIVIVAGLLIWLVAMLVLMAPRPYFRRPRRERMPAGVMGGRHVAEGGRSLMPHRTAPVLPLYTPEAQAEAQQKALAAALADAEQVAGREDREEREVREEVPRVPQARLREGGVPAPRQDREAADVQAKDEEARDVAEKEKHV